MGKTPQAALTSYPSSTQACQAAIDQVEKRSETFKAAVQGPQGDAQESKVIGPSVPHGQVSGTKGVPYQD